MSVSLTVLLSLSALTADPDVDDSDAVRLVEREKRLVTENWDAWSEIKTARVRGRHLIYIGVPPTIPFESAEELLSTVSHAVDDKTLARRIERLVEADKTKNSPLQWPDFVLTVDGAKVRDTRSVDGVLLRDHVWDGHTEVFFMADSRQANVSMGRSRRSYLRLNDLHYRLSPKHWFREATISRGAGGELILKREADEAFHEVTLSPQTCAVVKQRYGHSGVANNVRRFLQVGSYQNDRLKLPRIALIARRRDDKLSSFEASIVDEIEFDPDVDASTFKVELPSETVVVDDATGRTTKIPLSGSLARHGLNSSCCLELPIPGLDLPKPVVKLFGVLNINKPRGLSSRAVVNGVQRLVRPAKAGHAGTLDPLASGVLLVCVGPATRLISYAQAGRKTYRATFQLGYRSESDDTETELQPTNVALPVSAADIEAALRAFLGRIEQVPPRYSAVHVDGKRAYKLAREGNAVELKPRTVHVHRIDVANYCAPTLQVEIECGSGTYIRSIGRDLGDALGCGAVMSALERLRVGKFGMESAVDVELLDRETLEAALCSPLSLLESLPQWTCEAADMARIRNGRLLIPSSSIEATGLIAVLSPDGRLACLAETVPTGLQPRQVFVHD